MKENNLLSSANERQLSDFDLEGALSKIPLNDLKLLVNTILTERNLLNLRNLLENPVLAMGILEHIAENPNRGRLKFPHLSEDRKHLAMELRRKCLNRHSQTRHREIVVDVELSGFLEFEISENQIIGNHDFRTAFAQVPYHDLQIVLNLLVSIQDQKISLYGPLNKIEALQNHELIGKIILGFYNFEIDFDSLCSVKFLKAYTQREIYAIKQKEPLLKQLYCKIKGCVLETIPSNTEAPHPLKRSALALI